MPQEASDRGSGQTFASLDDGANRSRSHKLEYASRGQSENENLRGADAPPNIKGIVAVQAGILLIKCNAKYKFFIKRQLRDNPTRYLNDRKLLSSHFKQLCELETFSLLMFLWLNSNFLDDNQINIVGIKRKKSVITRNSLGNHLEELDGRRNEFNSSSKYIRRASRYVEAAMTFGLIALEEANTCDSRTNFKPLVATEKLHELMLEIGIGVALLIDAAFTSNDARNCSDESKDSEG